MSDESKKVEVVIPELPLVETVEAEAVSEVTEVVKVEEVKAVELSDVEVLAMSQGWRPKSEWKGDVEEYRSAKEFVERGELFSSIKHLKEQVRALVDTNQRIEKITYDKAMADLKSLQKSATEVGDVVEVEKLTDQISDLKIKAANTPAPPATPEQAEGNAFVERNKGWFNANTAENKIMRQYAIDKEIELRQAHPELSTARLLDKVESAVKEFFPKKFETRRSVNNSGVSVPSSEAVSTTSGPGKKLSYGDLPADLKTVYSAFKSINPNADLDKYIKEWQAMGVLPTK